MNTDRQPDLSSQEHRLEDSPPDSAIRHIPLVKLLIDGGTQTRAALNREAVDSYSKLMTEQEPALLPPIQVFEEPEVGFWVGDGFHRAAAATKAGFTEILAVVRRGTRFDALVHGLKSNHTHGVRRTNADKRRSVTLAFSEETLRGNSDRAIAELCGVGNQIVGDVRRDLNLDDAGQLCDSHSSSPAAKRKGRDGKMRLAVGHRRGQKTRLLVEANGEVQSAVEPADSSMPTFPAGSGKQDASEDKSSTTDGKQAEHANKADGEVPVEAARHQVDISADGDEAPRVAGEDSASGGKEETPALIDQEGFMLADGSRLPPTSWDDGPVPFNWTQGQLDNMKRNNDQLVTEKRRDILTLQAEQICMVELFRTANRLLVTMDSAVKSPMAILNCAVFSLRNYTNSSLPRIGTAHQTEPARH